MTVLAGVDDEPPQKRRRGVEGLAAGKEIKQSGPVTVYSGYSAVTAAPNAAKSQSASIAHSTMRTIPRQLPEGWEKRRSRTTDRVYYVNEKLNKTQWDPPAGSNLPVVPQKKQKVQKTRHQPNAQTTSLNGVVGLVHAEEANTKRWKRWQQNSKAIHSDED